MQTKLIIAVLSLAACSAIILFSSPVAAIGVGVSPHQLEVAAYPSDSVRSSIHVINTSDEESRYQVYIEEEDLSSWFQVSPQEFVVGPGDHQEVQLDISPPATASGEYQTNVCVVGLIHASELKVGCGVKVPVSIRILPPGPWGKVAAALPGNLSGTALLVIIISAVTPAATVVYLRRKRKTRAV